MTARIDDVRASSTTIPTEAPESDGTLTWDSTTVVFVEVSAGGRTGLGWTYGHAAITDVVMSTLAPIVIGRRVLDTAAHWDAMAREVRNIGRSGLASMAISAVDVALWDLRAQLQQQPLSVALGARRSRIPVYGSGGFCSLSISALQDQLADWAHAGMRAVKMKVGRDPDADVDRVHAARAAIGDAHLFVDANGAFDVATSLASAHRFAADDVRWFEEPVSSEDVDGLRLLRMRAPDGMAIAAGEYISTPGEAWRFLRAGAVDCLQADVTRCGGFTGFLTIAAACEAAGVPLSTHCAPQLSAQVAVAAPRVKHVEWFSDHVRVERLLLDGVLEPRDGTLTPDDGVLGHGMRRRVREHVGSAA